MHTPYGLVETHSVSQIDRPMTIGEQLAKRMENEPWAQVRRWLDQHTPDLISRADRLSSADESFRLDLLDPGEADIPEITCRKVNLYRALPSGACIRPGDDVKLDRELALNQRHGVRNAIDHLSAVDIDDIFWSGTSSHSFTYLPKAWRQQATDISELLLGLTPDALRILCDGEYSRIHQFNGEIEKIQRHIEVHTFDHSACGVFHGPEHWQRVADHGAAVARAMGIDPLVPHIFGLIHDSHREDEGMDPLHGHRSAAFVREHRSTLFSFLSDTEAMHLAHACELHSNGLVEAPPVVQACWDADRLDLWRVGVEPIPKYLCTAYAKRRSTISAAQAYFESQVERREATWRE